MKFKKTIKLEKELGVLMCYVRTSGFSCEAVIVSNVCKKQNLFKALEKISLVGL